MRAVHNKLVMGLATLALAGGMAGCGGGGGDGEEGIDLAGSNLSGLLGFSVEGDWRRCEAIPPGSVKHSFRLSQTAQTEMQLFGSITNYSAAGCLDKDFAGQAQISGLLKLQGGVLVQDIGTSEAVGFRYEGGNASEMGWGKVILIDPLRMKLSLQFNSSATPQYPDDTAMETYTRLP